MKGRGTLGGVLSPSCEGKGLGQERSHPAGQHLAVQLMLQAGLWIL